MHNIILGQTGNNLLSSSISNILVGDNCGENITLGSYNIALGSVAMRSTTIGRENIGIGVGSLQNNIGGDNNIGIGTQAGAFRNSQFDPLVNPEDSIYIGRFSMGVADGETGVIVIGSATQGNSSHTVTLGPDSIVETHLKGTVNVEHTGQIEFPSPSNPSSNPSVLDDYEEGNWSPDITCSVSGNYILNSASNTAAYVKIGSLVYVQAKLGILSAISPSGDIHISLPFTAMSHPEDGNFSSGSALIRNTGHSNANVASYVWGGEAKFGLSTISDDGAMSVIRDTDVDTTWEVIFGFSYRTE